MTHKTKFPRWLDAIWLIVLLLYVLAGTPFVPLHGDETTQIYMGRDFYFQFVEGDSQRLQYQPFESLDPKRSEQQYLRLLNGTIPKYLYGAAAYIGGYEADDINEQWAWNAGWQWNFDNGHVPGDDLLVRARWTSALMLAASVLVVFAIGQAIGGRGVAYLASAYYALNPAILINGRRAMMEGGMLLFTLSVLLIAIYLLKQHRWWLFVALGITSGLAVASKHTSVVTVASIFIVLGGCWLYGAWRSEQKQQFTKNLVWLLGAGIVSLVVFYALNPAWWTNPVARIPEVLDMRQTLLAGQVDAFGGYDSISEKVMGFWRQVFIAKPVYAEVNMDGWQDNLQPAITNYENTWWTGVSIGGSSIGGLILLLLTLMGVVALWRQPLALNIRLLITGWAIAMLLLTLVITPIEWQRYYIPFYPVVGLLSAMGMIFMWQQFREQAS